MSFNGVTTALITPFGYGGIDLKGLKDLVNRQIEEGVHGLLVCGTTGETPTLDDMEYDLVVRTVIEETRGRVPVMVGTGTNNSISTVERTRHAKDLGADAALVVTPYYNKPQQRGLVAHFKLVAQASNIPIFLYNVPSRTGVSLAPATTLELAQVPGIVGVKEASGSVDVVREIASACGPDFTVLSGDDGLALSFFATGAKGVISVASNVACAKMVAMWKAWDDGRLSDAMEIDRSLAPLYRAMFIESNPAPVKAAAEMIGICSSSVRPPLAQASDDTREKVRSALTFAGLL